jgi:indole-3-glycerol phosphate synthase
MNILDTIIAKKRIEVTESKLNKSLSELENSMLFKNETLSFKEFLLRKDKTGIIAEFKRQSPSKGIINGTSSVIDVTSEYAKYGASAISVLTDKEFFGGSLNDLLQARKNAIPVLRKEFIIDEYQLIEAKAFGADIILLIAACLSPNEVKSLAGVAKSIGLNVLLEIHDELELGHICEKVDVVGINNRNLKTFKVDISHSIDLCNKIPGDQLKISESGIDDVRTILLLRQNGFSGFLMGEKFMKETNPGMAFHDFVSQLSGIENESVI